jgi:hypothetical protein
MVAREPSVGTQLSSLRGRSLFLFAPKNRFRTLVAKAVFRREFDLIVMFIIIASSLVRDKKEEPEFFNAGPRPPAHFINPASSKS